MWGETPDLSLKQLSLPLPITQAATLTFPNIIGLYKYVTFFNNTAYQIALTGNGIPIFTCPALKNITVQIPAAIHQMRQANYVAVWSGSTGIPANQASLVFSENNLGLNIDLSPGAGTPGGTIDTDLLNILAELVIIAANSTSGTSGKARGSVTDYSNIITVGGTSQVVMAANINRNYLFVQNVSTGGTACDMWLNFTTTATPTQPSIYLPANAVFCMEDNFISTEPIEILGITTGAAYTAKSA
jgi:hypothetical protein